MIRYARRAGDRIFTIGVGAAVAEDLVQGLARNTGGACTLVHPNETMGDKIVRHFERIRGPQATATLTWPGEPNWQVRPQRGPVFAGDTRHWLAGFTTRPTGPVTLTFTLADGSTQAQTLDLQPWPERAGADTLPRLAADRRLCDLDRTTATALAVRYQLVSPYTHFVLRDQRDAAEQADSLPQVRQVPHQLAAGWGGMGTVASDRGLFAMRLPPSAMLQDSDMSFLLSTGPAKTSSRGGLSERAARAAPSRIMYGIPDTPVRSQPPALPPFSAYLEAQAQRLANPKKPLPTLAQVMAAGLPEALAEEITALLAQGAAEGPVIAAVLYGLLLQPASGRAAPRETLRRLRFMATRSLPRDQVERLVALAKSCPPPTS
jgi:Ca-activated chloride channel family protein